MNTNSKQSIARGKTIDGQPNPIDIHVGIRIKIRRTVLGLSQEKLARLVGLTFQQIQKYERGINRISASRLWDMANILGVQVNFFYEEMSSETIKQSPRKIVLDLQNDEETTEYVEDPMLRTEAIKLVKDYYKINPELAKLMSEVFNLLSKS